jgi:hypothetical protein
MYIGGQHMYLFSRTILIAILPKLYNMVYWVCMKSVHPPPQRFLYSSFQKRKKLRPIPTGPQKE